MRPIGHALAQAVLDRVALLVIGAANEVHFIAGLMFPVPSLPQGGFAVLLPGGSEPFDPPVRVTAGQVRAALDDRPAGGVIGVAGWQCPQTMQMVRQQYPGVDGEGMLLTGPGNGVAKRGANSRIAEQRLPPAGDDGEEEGTARHPCAAVVAHAASNLSPQNSRYQGTPYIPFLSRVGANNN